MGLYNQENIHVMKIQLCVNIINMKLSIKTFVHVCKLQQIALGNKHVPACN